MGGGSLFFCPEVEVLLRHLEVVVVALDISEGVGLEAGQALGVEGEVAQGLIYAFFVGLHVDDGAETFLADDGVVFRFAAAHHDEALRHGFEGVHGGRVAVELVEDDVAAEHERAVFGEGHALHANCAYLVGQFLLHALQGAEHDVGAFVGGAGTLDADEENYPLRPGSKPLPVGATSGAPPPLPL